MSYVPHIVLGAYLMMLIGIGIAGFLRSRKGEVDYYLAGRQQGVIVSTLTIMATFFSSAAMLGIPGLIYRDGVAFFIFAMNLPMAGAAIYILGSRIWRIGRARGYVTSADMLADYYDGSSAVRILVALIGFFYVVPYVVMQIKAGGYLAQQVFPDTQPIHLLGQQFDTFELGASLLSLITIGYVLFGGMRSVAWTDVVQGTLLLSGMLLTGLATVIAMGGVDGYWETVGELPTAALSLPGATGSWGAWKLLTICMFASVASMIQPGQWMRYYAARSAGTLRRSALIFATVLPLCFLFGVMLVGLGGRALYPPIEQAKMDGSSELLPHPAIGERSSEFDQIVIVMMGEQLPAVFGAFGVILYSLMMVAIMAASMSTADSNLHALSAVLTRDVYDRFVRPQASERERAWVGRGIIVVAALLALWLVHLGRHDASFKPLELIAKLSFVAIGFSCQLLPITIDVLFVRRGTRIGAVAGMIAGITTVMLFTPFPAMLAGENNIASLEQLVNVLRKLLDVGFCGMIINVAVFVLLSLFTKPPRRGPAEFAELLEAGNTD